ncbi:MAG: response regulator [Melioribacteraceae bacterium]|nr:response regulator [Melioribacteraceae bacterium]
MIQPKNVLLVEDNIDDINLIQRAVKKSQLPINLEILRDGETAVNYFSKNSNEFVFPKFVILDLNLPKISGIEVLKFIRNEPMYKKLPIVIFSSSHEAKDIDKCYEYCANSYIVKPIDYDKFQETIISIAKYWFLFNE